MKTHYDFLIIGAGPAGTPTAMALAQSGKHVLLVESGAGPGGTCLFEGCIPSKILRESARRLREINEAAEFGLCLPTLDTQINWSAIQERKQEILQRRSNAAMSRLKKIKSLDYIQATARFVNTSEAQININDEETQSIQFKKAIIATGSNAFRPPIRGINHPRVYDSESILNINHIPKELVIIGAGPIGVELGQVFNTFGSKVIILEGSAEILGHVDKDLATQLHQHMQKNGIEIHTHCRVNSILPSGQSVYVEYLLDGKKQHKFTDTVLVAVGRRPNISSLGLDNLNVQHNQQGITVDDTLQTTEPGIYAIGDVIGQPMFAHWATAQGLALARHLLGQPVKFPDPTTNTSVIFSEPELAMAGLTEEQAKEAGIDVDVAYYNFHEDARAQISGRDEGMLKIIYDKNNHKVVGVHALVEGADALMGEAALLIKTGLPIETIAAAIHPHPTLSESFVQAIRMAMSTSKL